MKKPTLSIRKILNPDRKTSGQLVLKFNADDPDDTAILKKIIHEQMAEDISLPLSRVIHHFSKSPYNWQEWHIVTIMARLVADRTVLLKTCGEVLDFRSCADMLLEKAEWKDVLILIPEAVSTGDLELVQHAAQSPFELNTPEVLYKAASFIKEKAEEWRRQLDSVRSKVNDCQIRTGKKGFDFRILLDELIRINDPVKVMERFQDIREQLSELNEYITDLDDFYSNHLKKWLSLLMTLNRVAANRLDLEKDPGTAGHLKRMDEIAGSARPYEMMHEIDDLISHIERFNDRLIAERRESSLRRLDQLIAVLTVSIETHKASSDLSNKALYPLRTLGKYMQNEDNIPRMRIKIWDAQDHADQMLERIKNETE